MDQATLVAAVAKLDFMGQRAGFSTEDLIRLLNEDLIALIMRRLEQHTVHIS